MFYKLILFIGFQVIGQEEYEFEDDEGDYEADSYGGEAAALPAPNPLGEAVGGGRRNRRGRRVGRIGRRKQMEFILSALAAQQ